MAYSGNLVRPICVSDMNLIRAISFDTEFDVCALTTGPEGKNNGGCAAFPHTVSRHIFKAPTTHNSDLGTTDRLQTFVTVIVVPNNRAVSKKYVPINMIWIHC